MAMALDKKPGSKNHRTLDWQASELGRVAHRRRPLNAVRVFGAFWLP